MPKMAKSAIQPIRTCMCVCLMVYFYLDISLKGSRAEVFINLRVTSILWRNVTVADKTNFMLLVSCSKTNIWRCCDKWCLQAAIWVSKGVFRVGKKAQNDHWSQRIWLNFIRGWSLSETGEREKHLFGDWELVKILITNGKSGKHFFDTGCDTPLDPLSHWCCRPQTYHVLITVFIKGTWWFAERQITHCLLDCSHNTLRISQDWC